jgi:hypothetical protein
MYKANEKYYKDFLSIMPVQKLEFDKREFLNVLEEYFNDAGFFEQLAKIQIKDDYHVKEVKKEIAHNLQETGFGKMKSDAEAAKRTLVDTRKKVKLKKMKEEDLKYRIEGDTIIFEDDED